MTHSHLEEIIEHLFDVCKDTLGDKGDDYAAWGRDRLHNFKVIAMRRGTSPEDVALFLQEKQAVALRDWVDDIKAEESCLDPSNLPWFLERIKDIINYHALLWALLVERSEGGPQE